jgi:hypothetical protein
VPNVSPIYVRTVWVARDSDETVRYRPVADDGPAPSVRAAFPPEPRPDDSGTGITAPFNAPTLGPTPWFVYEVKPRTATAVGTAEETPGSTRWRF